MAFEGTMMHFEEKAPSIDKVLFHQLESIGFPKTYDRQTQNYRTVKVVFDDTVSVFENCYKYLRVIRNNFIHVNKAYVPDTPERLSELLGWSNKFIDAVYMRESPFAKRALKIKEVLQIESY
ncbi:MAG: hypothetical protein CVT83_03460 [Alphaproteobacteria bacterium HGW-Alphaproteobacteria-5]|nr:MAG: hypothetical protein CVT83_03460 [Alphaproteobacteria bacterium HGW-Alphaproteobacteria-5]